MPDSLGQSTGSEESWSAAANNGWTFWDGRLSLILNAALKWYFFSYFVHSSFLFHLFLPWLLSFFFSFFSLWFKFPSFIHSFICLFLLSPLPFSLLGIHLFFFFTTISTNHICLLRFAVFVQHSFCISVEFGLHSVRENRWTSFL